MKARHTLWSIQVHPNGHLLKPLISTGMPYLIFTTKKEAKEHITKWNIQPALPVKITVTVQTEDAWH